MASLTPLLTQVWSNYGSQIGTLCSGTDSYWERLVYRQKNETTPNFVGPTMLRVVSFVLAVVCKRMQQLPTMLGAAVHRRGKDTDHKTSMRVSGPNNIGRAMHYASNIVGIRFGDHRTKEILRVVSSKVLLVSNFAQQLPTTRNNMQQCAKGRNIWQPTMLHPFTRDLLNKRFTNTMGAIQARRLTQGCTNHNVKTTEIVVCNHLQFKELFYHCVLIQKKYKTGRSSVKL